MKQFGPERVTLAFDVRIDAAGAPRVTTHGWRQQSERPLWSAVDNYAGGGLEARAVYGCRLATARCADPMSRCIEEAARRHPQISGRPREAFAMRAICTPWPRAGAAAAISGKALLEELIPLEELQPFLPNA